MIGLCPYGHATYYSGICFVWNFLFQIKKIMNRVIIVKMKPSFISIFFERLNVKNEADIYIERCQRYCSDFK